jgi:S-adenosylmethionine-diacylglycerol 3-amino-3-carboxypropyl transferase
MSTEAAGRADFSAIRYAQVWEDADVLVDGLDIQPGDTCLSIASAGDNALALLTRHPAKVYAVDLNTAQLACLALRVAAYRRLEHDELLELNGSRPSDRRGALYARLRDQLDDVTRAFWDERPELIASGIASAGKFERYFATFRARVLPLVHRRATVEALLRGGDRAERVRFYEDRWDTWRWRQMFRLFFSRFVMGRLGRDPAFFQYVEGSVADRILARARHALTELNPAENPYLHWILTGRHGDALPLALRPEHFDTIRANLDRLEWRCATLEDFLATVPPRSIHRFNLSDIFEYMSPQNSRTLLARLAGAAAPGGRLAYWNMLAPRSRPAELADTLRPLTDEAAALHRRDKAFFYSAFVLEEVTGG